MAKSRKITHSIQLKEMWRDISEYEGLYQISNFGRVKSRGVYRTPNYINN